MSGGLQRIGKYRIERRLGSGSFATVWLAYDHDLDVQVAIKMLANNWSADEEVKRRFLQEARMLFRLSDPRVVKVYTTGEHDDGCPYFVMDFADRGTLEERAAERRRANQPYGLAEALAVCHEIADCVAVVHRAGIVHRDLKPSNVLYRSASDEADGERMLVGDFGIARTLDAVGARSTIVAGSPYYMAPEQAEEETARDVDQRADVYACTVMLYELLTGRVPYPYATISEIRRAQDAGRLTPLTELRANVPRDIVLLVERGMAVKPAQRPPSMEAWAAAIDAALAGLNLRPATDGDETLLTEEGTETEVDLPPVAEPKLSTPAATPQPARPPAATLTDEVAAVPVVTRSAEPPPTPRQPEPVPQAREQPAPSSERGDTDARSAPSAGRSSNPPPRIVSEEEARQRMAAAGAASGSIDTPVTAAAKPKRRRGLAAAVVSALLLGGAYAASQYADNILGGDSPTPTTLVVVSNTPTPFVADTPTPEVAVTPTVAAAATEVIVSDSFEDPIFSAFPTFSGTDQLGEIVDGRYRITTAAGSTPWVTETSTPFARGYANVNVALSGDGSAGLVGRERVNSDGSTSLETCWVTSAGSAGCALLASTGWQTLFTVPNGSIVLSGNDLVTMQIDQGLVMLWVNSVFVGQAFVDSAASGYWGIIGGNYSGTSVAWFDDFYLVRYS